LTAPAVSAQYAFRCTTAGTAATEPAWPAANGNTVTTGGATFTNVSGQSTYGWSAAAGSLYSISASVNNRPNAGDRIFLSSDHSETTTGATYGFVGSGSFTVIQVISVNRAGSVPPVAADALSGAQIIASGGITFETYTQMYYQGITFALTGASSNSIMFTNFNVKMLYFRNCSLSLSGNSNGGCRIASNNATKVTLDNTTVTFGNAGQKMFNNLSTELVWINTPSAIGGVAVPTVLFDDNSSSGNATSIATLRGLDISALTTTLYNSTQLSFNKILLDSCRIAPGLARLGSGGGSSPAEVELVNCFDGTNIISERHTLAGDVTTDKTTTMVGGAQDDVGLYSLKMVSSTRSDAFAMTLDSFWLDVEDSAVGVARTATIEIVSSASLNNNDIRLMLEYQGTSGSSLASGADTFGNALITVVAVPTSTAAWNSPPATPVYQHLQLSFTALQAGRLRGRVRLGKPSTTVWVNPQIIVA
jgi:hypothetical protein